MLDWIAEGGTFGDCFGSCMLPGNNVPLTELSGCQYENQCGCVP